MAFDEEQILKGVNKKDIKAWKYLYDSYYASLCSYAAGILSDHDSAEDVVQDTLVRIWKSSRQFGNVKDFTWYLYRAVYNNAVYQLRSRNTHMEILHRIHKGYDYLEIPEEHFAETVLEEVVRNLYVYINELPEERRRILLLSLKGCSGKEIAEQLGISITTVKTQKNRGFRFLRQKLAGSVLSYML